MGGSVWWSGMWAPMTSTRLGTVGCMTWSPREASHGARPVHLITTMMKWIRTRRLSIKNSLSLAAGTCEVVN